jgi:hypothetical protein
MVSLTKDLGKQIVLTMSGIQVWDVHSQLALMPYCRCTKRHAQRGLACRGLFKPQVISSDIQNCLIIVFELYRIGHMLFTKSAAVSLAFECMENHRRNGDDEVHPIATERAQTTP